MSGRIDSRIDAIGRALAVQLGTSVRETSAGRVHGGSINECHRLETGRGPLFVKLADARLRTMLDAEADGLSELAAATAVRVPQVLAIGEIAESAYLQNRLVQCCLTNWLRCKTWISVPTKMIWLCLKI